MNTAIYTRVSTEEQKGGFGLSAQLTQCEAMAIVKGWEPIVHFTDEGISGSKDESERNGLKELLEAAKSGDVRAVIVSALDRLGRNTSLILRLVDELNGYGVKIVSCKESIDTTTATGQFVLTVFAGLAQLERDTIKERMTNGRNERGRKDGERGGRVPMGYYRIFADGKATGEIAIDEGEAEIVKRIFVLRKSGQTLQEIADTLNNEAIPTRRGAQWARASVKAILDNEPKYRGGYRGKSAERWPVILE